MTRPAAAPLLDEHPADPGVRDVQLVPAASSDGLAAVIERLAANPSVDVDKLERIITLQERILRVQAEADFNKAFAFMQPDIPTIIEKGSTDKGTYAPLEDIVEVVRPILAKHGFSVGFKTEWPDKATVKVVGILTMGTHSRFSEFQSGADQSGSKNAIQALASSVSYGKRYALKDLLCIVTRGEDDDGRKGGKADEPEAPEGYDAWMATLEGVAADGMAAFSTAWNSSKKEYRDYLARTAPKMLAAIKTKAAKVKP